MKNNATQLVWPFIEDMLEGSNSSLVIGAAWSVYAHLIPTSYSVAGPFWFGLSSLPWREEHLQEDSGWRPEHLIINRILTDLYTTAWEGSYQALDKAGYLEPLDLLSSAILAMNGTLPIDNGEEDRLADFFLKYNREVPTDLIVSNIPSPNSSVALGSPKALSTASPVGLATIN